LRASVSCLSGFTRPFSGESFPPAREAVGSFFPGERC
jgi:hypothetical protein